MLRRSALQAENKKRLSEPENESPKKYYYVIKKATRSERSSS
jgi:hypothetical protein